MRILTNSPFETKGFISIIEADENAPQTVVFCIPINLRVAEKMLDVYDFQKYFLGGISTKIKDGDHTNTIDLDYVKPRQSRGEINSPPKFVANIKGYEIDFYLSPLNYLYKNNSKLLNINSFYSGNYLRDELADKRLVIVEPNWRQLDKLFLEERVVFTDWK